MNKLTRGLNARRTVENSVMWVTKIYLGCGCVGVSHFLGRGEFKGVKMVGLF